MIDFNISWFYDQIIILLLIIIILHFINIFSNRRNNNNKISKSNKNIIKNKEILLSDNTYFDRGNKKLREEYIKLHGLSRSHAAEVLDRQIELLKKNHPGKDMKWYIEKAIYDLKRDRHTM